jgi:CHAT domain-containing protein/tetratricopeptide (TPR) repeat protein
METEKTHEPMTAAQAIQPGTAPVLHLEAGLAGDRIRVSLAVQRSGEMQTMRQVEELSVAMARIDRRCQGMVQFLNQANRQGRLPPEVLSRLQETGQLLRDELFSPTIKQRLNADAGDTLVLTLDDTLVHLPWELLHDGHTFLGQRFAMGRVVRTRQPVLVSPARELAPPLAMLVLADPCGDLRAAYEEGIQLRDLAESRPDLVQVTFRSTGVQSDFLKAKLRHFDLIHFAGHADFHADNPHENGWRLGNGRLSPADIQRMAGTGRMPALVFANACQSARSAPRTETQMRMFTMANAFLRSGVRHYLGTFWEIPDDQSRQFALAFYQALLDGSSVGAAVLAARHDIMARFGQGDIVWASYLLYGDPTCTYLQPTTDQQAVPLPDQGATGATAVPADGVRAPEDKFHLGAVTRRSPARPRWWGAAVLLLAAIGAWSWWSAHSRPDLHDQAQKALTAFRAGEFEQVRQVCGVLQHNQPEHSLGYLLMGNVHFYNGELERAQSLYRHAVQASQGPDMEKAEAFIGLGRIASVRGSMEEALNYYRQASQLAPDDEHPLVAQALLQDRAGRPDKAVALLEQARPAAADAGTLEALALQIRTNAALKADAQRQARIDQLIHDLVQQMQTEGMQTQKPAVAQNHRFLTIWLNDLESTGYSLQEGTATLIASGLMGRLLATRQIKFVERDLLDGLMNEIKLGTSPLTDPGTRLQLGQLTAARIILTGRVVHSAPYTQVTLRCIETDTGRIFAVVNAHFEGQTPIAAMVDKLADELLSKIKAKYPLQAEIKGAPVN